ncbi:hypothetical protein RclHR1_04080004 [Rhizophagus clarus]|uniref:RNase H type-1 domain-containing protein n=1 Tax=Rhizophagus clarus TaxID=94130 RepID=A0A2Z6RER2_9GLOM|nr:hypothetical protein RclHR1_04080004 [Rhizophagus clarus]
MLKFALERIHLPASSIKFILSLFMNRSNWVFTTHGDTPSYRVRIGIDQGEVISPLLWVIYIDLLLTVLKKEMLDHYILRPPSLLPTPLDDNSNLVINNLVFMDDSTLVSSSKSGLEHMLSITEEFYVLNNTSANNHKYVLISNSLPLITTSNISPVEFNLSLFSLNRISSISVTSISVTSSFQFLGVWFNIKGSRDFVKKQIADKCNSFAATLRPAKLSAKQVVYLYNMVLIPKLEYHMQVTHLSDRDCYVATRHVRSLVKQKANFSRALPNPILFLSQALRLINLSSHLIQCHANNLFLMANSTTFFIQRLFVYRLMLIQFQFLIPANTTIPDSHDHLYDRYVCSPSTTPVVSIVPGITTNQKNRRWLVSLDGHAAPLFGKQLTVQPKKDTCIIVHWTSDCLSSPGDVIRLHPCPGCDAHVPFPAAIKYTTVEPRCTITVSLLRSLIPPTDCERIRQSTTVVVSPYSWADFCDQVVSYYNCLFIPPDFSSSPPMVDGESTSSSLSRDSPGLPLPVILPPGSYYQYYTDGSLINLGSPEVSMGWSWVQVIPDAGYLNSVATYTHGTIRNWPSSTRAEIAAIYAALSVTLEDSVISIYTDSQAAIDGLRSCASSTYTNSHFYYKTTNFELWAAIECCIQAKRLSVLSVKINGHDGNYWNEFANSLANSAYQSDDAFLLSEAIISSSHTVRLVYDTVTCESNPRRLFKVHYQAIYMQNLLALTRFQFTFYLTDRDDYIIDWDLTWFTLNYSPTHDASFQAHHTSRHFTFKFKLFLDDLSLLEMLKITHPDLYIDLLTCRSCCNRKEDLMHLILCSKRHNVMHQIFQSYQNHLFSKLREAGELADKDPTPMFRKLSSLSC